MEELSTLEAQAIDAVNRLRGPALATLVKYLDAQAADTARRAMKTPRVADVRRAQGEHAAIRKIADLLREDAAVPKRSVLRHV